MLTTVTSYFKNSPACVPHDLAGNINDLSSHRGCVTTYFDYRSADIFFEHLVQKKRCHHGVVKSTVLSKPFKRKLFAAKVLKCPMHQFVSAPSMIARDDLLGAHHLFQPNLTKTLI